MLPVFSFLGEPGETFNMTSSDEAQSLPAAVLTVAGKRCKAVMITTEDEAIVIAFGGAIPTQWEGDFETAPTVGHTLWVVLGFLPLIAASIFAGTSMVATLKFISATPETPAVVAITPFY